MNNKNFRTIANNKIAKFYLTNKFFYKTSKKIPVIKKLSVNFNQKSTEFKHLLVSSVATEILFLTKGRFLTTKRPNILLKTKKNQPIGCKLVFYNKILILQILKIIFKFK